jgi:hypothetical protein
MPTDNLPFPASRWHTITKCCNSVYRGKEYAMAAPRNEQIFALLIAAHSGVACSRGRLSDFPRTEGRQGAGLAARIPGAARSHESRAGGAGRRALLLPRPRRAGEGRAPSRPFDQVFAQTFKGLEAVSGEGEGVARALPEEWLRRLAEKHLTEEEKALVESLGGWDKLMETLKQRLEGAAGPASGRLEMDRHRRHLALRRLWLQPRGRAHRPA